MKGKYPPIQGLQNLSLDCMNDFPVPFAVIAFEPEFRFVDANNAMWKKLGYETKAEFLRVPATVHCHEVEHLDHLKNLTEQGPVHGYEMPFRSLNPSASRN